MARVDCLPTPRSLTDLAHPAAPVPTSGESTLTRSISSWWPDMELSARAAVPGPLPRARPCLAFCPRGTHPVLPLPLAPELPGCTHRHVALPYLCLSGVTLTPPRMSWMQGELCPCTCRPSRLHAIPALSSLEEGWAGRQPPRCALWWLGTQALCTGETLAPGTV